MPRVFADWRCSQAILDFLAHTEVGRSYPKPNAAGEMPAEADSDSEDEDDDDKASEDTDEPTGGGGSG